MDVWLTETNLVYVSYFAVILELCAHIAIFPVSALNFYVVYKTSVIHRNMKFILIWQTLAILIFSAERLFEISIKLYTANIYWDEYVPMILLRIFAITFGNTIGYAFLFERIWATLAVKTYENYKKPYFSIIWLISIMVVSFSSAYFQSFQKNAAQSLALGVFLTFSGSVCFSLAEIFILSALTLHNEKRYNKKIFMERGHSLTESYQMSENIRTGRQLAPTFLFHFLNTIAVAVASILFFYWLKTAKSKQVSLVALFLTMAIANLGILTTIIRCHPILNRRAVKLCADLRRRIFCMNSVTHSHISYPPNASVSVNHPMPTTIDGNSLINTHETDEYFKMLRTSWDNRTGVV